jgi:hypothetical protein
MPDERTMAQGYGGDDVALALVAWAGGVLLTVSCLFLG